MTDVVATPAPIDEPAAPQAPPKLDPESLAIRTPPARAIRIKRSVVITLSAVGMCVVIFATWAALRHTSLPRPADQEQAQPAGNGAGDSLDGLARTYADVPKLGPPLPGDLGKPMLDQQRARKGAGGDLPGGSILDPSAQQRQAETKAALRSGLMVNASVSAPATAPGAPNAAEAPGPTGDTKTAIGPDPDHDPNGQGHKADFIASLAKDGTVNPHALTAAPSPYLLSAGSVIAASLITGLRSDLPGLVTAQVSEDVYDSPTGRILLVPQGSRLIGRYDSVVAFGQKRALIVWQRIIMPDGSSVSLDNMPAADPAGYAGLEDKVDFHSWQLLKGVAISTLLGIGSDLQFSGNGGLVEAIRQSGTQNVSRAGDQLTAKSLDIQPTLTIRPGAPVRLLVDCDLILAPWKGDR